MVFSISFNFLFCNYFIVYFELMFEFVKWVGGLYFSYGQRRVKFLSLFNLSMFSFMDISIDFVHIKPFPETMSNKNSCVFYFSPIVIYIYMEKSNLSTGFKKSTNNNLKAVHQWIIGLTSQCLWFLLLVFFLINLVL